MTNDLLNLKKNLKSFAKRCKDFKYTDSALLAFLLSGMLISTGQVFAETVTNSQINNQVSQINTSINQMRTDFKRARAENNKLIKDTNLELTQLMEQGDHVTKSPWSSWQFGVNGFYSDWHGTYKGKGNKISNIIYKRDQTLNKYIAKPVSEKNANNTTLLGFAYEPNAEIPISASITPKSISKINPNIQKNVAIVSLPSFEPRVVVEPVAPNRPNTPGINPPSFNISAKSDGNGTSNVAFGNGNNGAIEMVALTAGDFNVTRTGDASWSFNYSGYSGKNAFAKSTGATAVLISNDGTENINENATWSGKSYSGTSSGLGFMSVIGNQTSATMYNNANFTYTRVSAGAPNLGELVHLDVHGVALTSDERTKLSNAGAPANVLTAFDDATGIARTSTQTNSAITFDATRSHTWINNGNIIIQGGDTSLTNTYSHDGHRSVSANEVEINTGNVTFQPYFSGGSAFDQKTAVFVVTPNNYNTNRLDNNIHYNGRTGTINTWTRNAAIFTTVATDVVKPLTTVNKGTINMYGKKSAGIYTGAKANLNIIFKDGNDYKPITLYGDDSIGLFVPVGQGTTVEGDFATDIGSAGLGNQKFSGYDVNPDDTDAVTGIENNNIQNSFGIYSGVDTDLTSHQIRIYDKTESNVGVMPSADVHLKIGTGKIEINGGNDAKNNIGIYVNGHGSVTSTGDIKIDKGIGNLAVFAKGGTPVGATEQVSVNKIEGTSTKNSIFIYAESNGTTGATVKASELNISNATIEADADTDNKKDTGAIFATGENTVVTVTRTATPTSANIEITGRERKNAVTGEADGYVGFGFFANNKAKINANYNSLKVTNGSSAVVAQNANTEINMDHGKVEYSGPGYALFSDGSGKINLTNGELVLDGKATGFSVDYNATTQPIDLTSTTVNINSDDAILMSVKNVTSIGTTGMGTALLSKVNLTPANIGGTGTRYKFAVLDGATINVDGNIDKADTTSTSDSYIFTRRIQLQNSIINVLSGNTVKAHLNSTELTSINPNLSVPVGLDVSASGNSTSRATTGVNVANGATISVDRTDSGNGGVGAYVNYGTISNDGKIEVEKTTPNDFAVGLYATNGTQVDNKANGTIEVGGKDSIGILGLSYRIDSAGNVVYEKFGTAGPAVFATKLGYV